MTFTVDRLIKYLETFPKDLEVSIATKTKDREYLPNQFEYGRLVEMPILDITEYSKDTGVGLLIKVDSDF